MHDYHLKFPFELSAAGTCWLNEKKIDSICLRESVNNETSNKIRVRTTQSFLQWNEIECILLLNLNFCSPVLFQVKWTREIDTKFRTFFTRWKCVVETHVYVSFSASVKKTIFGLQKAIKFHMGCSMFYVGFHMRCSMQLSSEKLYSTH